MFSGSIVALITPFKNNKLDIEGLKKNLQFQLENNTDGFLPCGTTGETPSLEEDEWIEVVKTTIEFVNRRKPVIVGTGTNNTKKTVKYTELAEKLGADACLVVSPYYNKPTQEGLYYHFKEVSQSVKIPIILYNIPSRTGVNILPKTIERLVTECKNIIGIKEASGNLDQVSEIISRLGNNFVVLSGDDSLTLPILSLGGKGVISVLANILPKETHLLVKHFLEGNIFEAQKIHLKYFKLMKALFVETNPIPIKTAMNLMGLPAGELRLPLTPMTKENLEYLKSVLKELNLI
ncbi:MAG: 4-hydroxy-tetrahydrodipicolinate synthase [candidate division WOR-3 bacterium]|nr:4-hydroxy-tetrahydrodipicolinate synthase [candidate division WOR-3 bacterium]MCX7837066.1 4-hydroxy-tetrahydrodipicolinate synthase [candidate division WOR-3 bacterium]MDW8113423.1 4-hydroxy-tetrahydrodipicolinate synthase [candidate division WOR-3 bacterium]